VENRLESPTDFSEEAKIFSGLPGHAALMAAMLEQMDQRIAEAE